MSKYGWIYKGTTTQVKIGDRVKLSKRYAIQFGFDSGIVTSLHGFITVQLPNGDKVDFDSRSISQV